MTRTGKIPRLPLSIRNTLGERLRNGGSGKPLLDWLNALPEVRAIMAASFEGRPITKQNLSEWRHGGYVDWLRYQESAEWASQMQEQMTELTQAASGMPLTDGMATLLTVALGRMLKSAMAQPLETPAQRNELLVLATEITRLRRQELRAATLKLRQDKHADNLRRETEKRARADALEREHRARQEHAQTQPRQTAEPTHEERLQSAIASFQVLKALSKAQPPPTTASSIAANAPTSPAPSVVRAAPHEPVPSIPSPADTDGGPAKSNQIKPQMYQPPASVTIAA